MNALSQREVDRLAHEHSTTVDDTNDEQAIRDALDIITGGTLRPLSDWEERFIESITEQFESRAWLSDRQIEILNRIVEEKA